MSTYQVWTDSEVEQLRAMAQAGDGLSVIARKLERNRESVRQKARHLDIGIATRKTRSFTPAEDALIIAGEHSAEELATKFGRSRASVYARMRRLRIKGGVS